MSPLLKKDDRLGEAENLQRWAVVRKIGDGGFAEVYEVRDTLNDDAQVWCPFRGAWTAFLSFTPGRSKFPSQTSMVPKCWLVMQFALKIDKPDRRRDARGGTVKAEAKVGVLPRLGHFS